MYRPGFSGHKILLCGRPDWGECGEPFAPGLSRAAGGILLQQPVLVIARDEGPDRAANLLGIAEDPAPHDLLLEGADEPLRHTIGLGLADEGKARRHAEEGDLVLDVVGHKGAAVVVAEQKAAGGVGPHRPAGGVDGEIDSLGGGEAVGLFGDVPAERLGVPVLNRLASWRVAAHSTDCPPMVKRARLIEPSAPASSRPYRSTSSTRASGKTET